MLLAESQAWLASDVSPPPLAEWFESGVLSGRASWSIAHSGGNSRLVEAYNHVLALAIRLGLAGQLADEFEALAQCRISGGGWSETTCEDTLSLRNTCLAAENLCLAGADLNRPGFARIGLGAVALVIGRQGADGMWSDAPWDAWDTTAASLGLLAAAGQVEGAKAATARALTALADKQGRYGAWPGPFASDASAGRLLAGIVRADGHRSAMAAAASGGLIAAQGRDGSWGSGMIEETSAATEGLLTYVLAGGVARGLEASIDRGVRWLTEQASDGQWPESPKGPAALIPTCGAIACLALHAEYRRS
jgi:hypothetical protein